MSKGPVPTGRAGLLPILPVLSKLPQLAMLAMLIPSSSCVLACIFTVCFTTIAGYGGSIGRTSSGINWGKPPGMEPGGCVSRTQQGSEERGRLNG